ncbi:MAG: Na(+)-translocating NADH-quinone reductase subunit C [Acidobacteria bacterium]|nr:Na(+)-translocating NADH-quinone reductase subunit C [Acidobacteriota bacterium]
MQRDSVTYIVGFAAVVCIVCGLMVSSAAVALKTQQTANAAFDKQRNVLYATGLASPAAGLSREQLETIYDERVKPVVIDLKSGDVVDSPSFDPATYDMDKAADGADTGMPAPENSSSIQRLPKEAVIYQVTGEGGEVEMIVLPIKGYGLWSTLYGFLALDKDTTTVRGITYYKHGETPGLGGEVDNPNWKAKWPGRKAYNDQWQPALQVIKGQAGPPSSAPHQVDGLSGASITSRGVSNMLHFWLGDGGFAPYLAKFREQHS